MSIALPLVDLTNAGIGTKGTVSFQSAGIGIGGADSNPAFTQNRPHINIFNDSKCMLFIQFIQDGHSDHLQAGAWRMYDLTPGEAGFTWLVESVMNVAAPISQLSCTYYFPNERVDSVGTLGNSPIGGGVNTSAIQTLTNEGGPRNILIVDIGDLALANLINLYSDHFLMSVDQAGIAHQVLKGNIAGNPLQIGQAGDITEVLGQLTIDQLLNAAANLAVAGTSTFTGDATHNGNIIANGGENVDTIRDNGTGTPAIDLSNHDGTVKFPQIIIPNKAPTVTNGNVAGTHTFATPFWGQSGKMAIITMAGLNHNAAILSVFPSVISRAIAIYGGNGGTGVFNFQNNGSNVGVVQILTLGTAGAAGTSSSQPTGHQFNIVELDATATGFLTTPVAGVVTQGVVVIIGL